MSAPAAPGFRHDLLLHRAEDELVDVLVPFVRGALEADDACLLLARPPVAAAVLAATGPAPDLAVVPVGASARRPATGLRVLTDLLEAPERRGRRVRLVTQVPPVPPGGWHEWRRAEAATGAVLGRFDVWSLCAYDESELGDAEVEDLLASHPAGHGDADPGGLLRAVFDAPPHLVESTPPAAELHDPSPAQARAALARVASAGGVHRHALDDLLLAASEAVANAIVHGRPPVLVRVWVHDRQATVTVTDGGAGPQDPLVGLVPAERPVGGLGLWIAHRLVDVAHRRHAAGYTIRLTSGSADGPPLEL